MQKPQWRATALAIAAAVLLGAPVSDANALALGRITVQSALGEPLRAEIDIPEINAEEIASLKVAVGSPDVFRAAGLEFNPSLTSIQITLQRRPDGRHFLQLSSPRAINDPFVDLILETNWSSGRIVRDYTMLFDPPNLRQSAPLAAQVSPAPAAPSAGGASQRPAAPTASPPAAPPAVAGRTARPAAGMPSAPATRAAVPSRPAGEGKQVTVQSGDTAGKIAAANKPATVSLDQMLVAMLRANPEAFIGGNVNRLKSGAVLEVPSADEAGLVPSGEATQTLVVQSRDFNEFRRRLAEGLPTTSVGGSDRQASGRVQAKVEDKKAGTATPDKLTLSKGAVQGKAAADKIASDRAAQEAATRVAEINKNIADLNKLGVAAPAATSASAAKPGVAVPMGAASAAKPAAPVAAPVVTAPAASAVKAASAPTAAAMASPMVNAASASVAPVAAAASAPTPVVATAVVPAAAAASAIVAAASAPAAAASMPIAAASAPLVAAVKPPVAAASKARTPPPETSLLDDMMENPIVPASIVGALLLLLGFGFYRAQQRKKSTQVDSSFLESRLQPDSFFGASGGQRIDTNEGGSQTGSSMVYSPSQLDAAGDVDPVAEADVYLAYGRDLQAEEILKEAMRTTPQRVAVHSKLLEIYSKRRDARAFELVATEAYGLTRGTGPEWEHICELGQELESTNPLYRPGGHPVAGAVAAAAATTASGSFGSTTATPAYTATAAQPASGADIDLDLDFSIDEPAPAAAVAAPPRAAAPPPPAASLSTLAMTQPMPALDMDFGSATVSLDSPAKAAAAPTEPVRLDAPDLTLDENSLSFSTAPVKAAAPAPTADPGMIEFDLGALSLDIGSPPAAAPKVAASGEPDTESPSTSGSPLSTGGFDDSGSGDPLATKLALAQEFNAIGDPDGARSLAQEVLAEASGDLKSKAQRFLAEIS